MRRLLPISLIFALVLPVQARSRSVRRTDAIPAPVSLLWIAAHPDDEAVIAPLLAYWCRDLHARCGMMVLTRGEAGACLKQDGCEPDVASVRAGEAGQASQYFGAESILLTLPDGGGASAPAWKLEARPELADRVAGYIQAFDPEIVVTFDPRHGTTGHPDHRAVGEIVLAAVKTIPAAPALFLLESTVTVSSGPLRINFGTASTTAARFDANVTLASSGQAAWNAIIDDMRRHQSQFDEAWLDAIRSVPTTQRAVYIEQAP